MSGHEHGHVAGHPHEHFGPADPVATATRDGVRATWIALGGLMVTALLQLVALRLARRSLARRYPYGFHRAEDLAGVAIVRMIALSAVVAALEALQRLLHPQPIDHVGWVLAAGVVGALGFERAAPPARTGATLACASVHVDPHEHGSHLGSKRRAPRSMGPMEPQPTMPPPPSHTEYCYRHPAVATGVHCTRCDRPICTDCMIPAPVGYHCPSCVSEARREFRKGPGRRIAVADAKATSVTAVLLVAIVGMYLIEVAVGGAGSFFTGPNANQLVRLGGAVAVWPTPTGTVGITQGQYWRLFTSMFLHGGLIHLGFNAYALWIFGRLMEEELGRIRYSLVYLITGLFAGAISYAFAAFLVQPDGRVLIPPVAVGASGAIFGIFGAFVAFNWRRRHSPLAAARLRMALILIVINAALGLGSGGAIDWRAHAGGLVAGLLLGYAAEGFGRVRNERLAFAIGCIGLAAATVGIALWKTAQLHQRFPGLL